MTVAGQGTLQAVPGAPVVDARDLTVVESGNTILRDVSVRLEAREHLTVLGPNGSGKTTLLRVLATYRYPTRGEVSLLGHRFGRVDVRALRPRVGFVSVALDPLVDAVPVLPLVAGGHRGTTAPSVRILADPDAVTAARQALTQVGARHLADRRVDTLSQGERQRVRIARALASSPDLLLLDEPFAGLDLGGRESLLADLDRLLTDPGGPTVVLVTHHLEELPPRISRALLLAGGAAVASGPIAEVLTSSQVSAVFGVPVIVERADDGRWRASGSPPGLDETVRLT
ncbi:ABC transporter ATP-binding protein [Nitriliruptor alkaliphilus]|uniref:ABC transporter ATP-binding protein n=1 Tax=Nitriliruptor alkaliphilus TaxID=427918 RepID=UPI000696BAA1|nr:ATP-binding cassette domain-containing protein [Nitriliruptor alkaliphilus]